eukprot:CAMPEP_0115000828 /NCGR_PEP_ID=MMETSP0216-20121206/16998_1 /TAXON_ID=223996 /ORGANISM="Protocruzia adherens, Strain Boccale" /LENGTH=458 /DNA_ID=CAMNT_0002366017 /DNA_START=422 /DNA_END=1798 /DNA_ORIENTATION=+
MIAGKKYQGLNVDIWSSGVILFALICGYLPFEDPNTANLYKKILGGEYQVPKWISPEGRHLVKSILNTDPEERYTVHDIREHPWYIQARLRQYEGIIVGYNQVPIDEKIINQVGQYGFDVEYTRKCLEANKHNPQTTTYHLLLKKYIQGGGKSEVDPFSDTFNPALTMPRPKHKKTPSLSINLNMSGQPHPPLRKLILENHPRTRRYAESVTAKRTGSTGGSSSRTDDLSLTGTLHSTARKGSHDDRKPIRAIRQRYSSHRRNQSGQMNSSLTGGISSVNSSTNRGDGAGNTTLPVGFLTQRADLNSSQQTTLNSSNPPFLQQLDARRGVAGSKKRGRRQNLNQILQSNSPGRGSSVIPQEPNRPKPINPNIFHMYRAKFGSSARNRTPNRSRVGGSESLNPGSHRATPKSTVNHTMGDSALHGFDFRDHVDIPVKSKFAESNAPRSVFEMAGSLLTS